MTAINPNNTVRFYLDYSDGINGHTLIARLIAPATAASAASRVNDFLTDLAPALNQISIVGARLSAAGSNVSNPVAWTYASTYGTGTLTGDNAPRELRFQGRSTDGRRCSVSVYGTKIATPVDYRVQAGENAAIDAAITRLTTASAFGVFATISGLVPIWKTYCSFNFNSYWEQEARP